jgi:predicted secreted protein
VIPLLLVAASLGHAAPAPKTLTEADSGKTVTIAPHQLLRIKLDEASDGGFEWLTTVKPDPAVLAHRKTRRTSPPCPTREGQVCPVGQGVTVYFRYVGNAAGRTKLRLGEYRFGRRSSKPAETFRLTVRVR